MLRGRGKCYIQNLEEFNFTAVLVVLFSDFFSFIHSAFLRDAPTAMAVHVRIFSGRQVWIAMSSSTARTNQGLRPIYDTLVIPELVLTSQMRVVVAVVNQRIPNVVQIVNDAPFCIYAFQFVAVALRLKLNYVGPTILLEILFTLLAVCNH